MQPRPNILWITCEDICPDLGCYGDAYAHTPNLDRLAAKSLTYVNCWSNAPVCAPARTAIITGMHPTAAGAEHMRSITRLPAGIKMYPQYLREAGYYCTNNSKEDYNLEKPGQVWDESSPRAHWRNRRPDQPFFAVFNLTVTHESGIRKRPHELKHDPSKARIPPYHPDTPEVRHDWAQYYDNITTMDEQAGQRLKELEEAGLAEETIVFFYGDNGCGMPRGKRFLYELGLRVPLIVHVPVKFSHLAPKDYAPGTKTDRLVSFVDLAPTLLSLVGLKPPTFMHGHAFMGLHEAPPQSYLYGFRGRMDERYDLIRAVRDKRYVYIRNYMPHLIYGQHVSYMFETPTTRVWKRLFEEGRLTPAQAAFWRPKPPEELYDLQEDPDEVNNLANSHGHRDVLERLRRAHREFILQTRDVGFLPEDEIHRRSTGSTPYEMGRDERVYPLEKILATAELAASFAPEAMGLLVQALRDTDSAVRYWAVMGLLIRGQSAVQKTRDELRRALADESPSVRIAAAQALGQYGDEGDLRAALAVLLDLSDYNRHGAYPPVQALNAIDALGSKAAAIHESIRALPTQVAPKDERPGMYIARLIKHILEGTGENEH